ncbi:GntR family transcriptional regulator [Streptomyces sp. SM14]|uniref:GntR family transcriptional regulator n=1 Tax=Streptomyces sp. SM14 TaxID=1736045 RepID=UPI000CD4E572|nr:GntR family transcriptional regulator [Streptomyces sp. SM14]
MPQIQRSLPPYMQVTAAIREQIETGQLKPGDLLPTDRKIAEDWKISRATAQKALTVLKVEGVIEAVQGSGTRVAADDRHRSGRDRAAAVRKAGRIYTPGEYAKITKAELTPAPADVAEVLDIDQGAPAIRRVRITYTAENVARSASTSWYDGALAAIAPLLLKAERIKEGSWRYLEEKTDRAATHGQDRISERNATPEEAEILGLEEGAALKVTRTILRDADGLAIEYGVSISGGGRESVYDYDL